MHGPAPYHPLSSHLLCSGCVHPGTLQEAGVSPLVRRPTSILQLNIGLYCNQACKHCHVESSPK